MSISRILIAATAGAALLAAVAVSADERTEADIPDLSGLWEPPGFDLAPPDKGGPGPVLNMSKNIQQPVGDYKNPVLQPWAAAQVKKWGDEITAGRVPDHVHTLCMPMQVPGVMTLHNAYEFLQLKDKVVILIANQAQARYVYLNVPHSKTATPSWYGESVGHYEGDTLVIDTIGLKTHPLAPLDRFGTPHTESFTSSSASIAPAQKVCASTFTSRIRARSRGPGARRSVSILSRNSAKTSAPTPRPILLPTSL